MNDENEELGGGSRTAPTRTTPVGKHARAAMQFLQDVAEDPCTAPADRVAAANAVRRASVPPPKIKSATSSAIRIVVIGRPETYAPKAPPTAANADSIEQWAAAQGPAMLLQLVEVMNDEGAPMRTRISAAGSILREAPDVEEAKESVAYLDDIALRM